MSPSRVGDDPRFDQICIDEDLKNNLKMRWAEAQMCQFVGASLASVILLGSILEGLLLSVLGDSERIAKAASKAPRDRVTKVVREIEEWKLKEMIDVAAEIGMVGKSASKHSHELRDSRNLVHPQKQINESLQVDESLLNISFEVVNAVLDSLVKFKINEKIK